MITVKHEQLLLFLLLIRQNPQIILCLAIVSRSKKIDSILSSLDNKIELNNKINKNLEEMAHAI